jgi:uncharacterized membrane protein YfcA
MVVVLACVAAFVAGFVDAVAGGGGLVQLPALFVLFPDVPVPDLLGTNKVSSIAGTGAALARYAGSVRIDAARVAPAAAAAFVGSYLGARLATVLPSEWMRPLAVVLLVAVAVYTFAKRDLGAASGGPPRGAFVAVAIGAGCGLYDGFFGPGTGSFLLFAFVALLGMDFLAASAAAKVVNVATNVAAILAFASAGHVRWELALPMAACNVAGARIGAHLAITRGAGFVRGVFLVVVSALLARLTWDLL